MKFPFPSLVLPCLLSLFFSPPCLAEREWPLKKIEVIKNKKSHERKPVIVAIIDTGVDANHNFIKSMLWNNPGEIGLDKLGRDKSKNKLDDDQNGFVDDIHGWNFVNSDSNLSDQHGHGTHIAGIMASVSSGQFPPTASQYPIQLMILKYYTPEATPFATMRNTILAIEYAIRHGAHIINYSGGGLNPNPEEKLALQQAERAGVLVVAAAGNESSNSDVVGYYPANYELSNILSVGAINQQGKIIESSNFGKRNVDLVAPGDDIPSALPEKTFGLMTGTSQATAFASAVAAMVLSERPTLSPKLLIEHLSRTAAFESSLVGKIKSESILNAKRSLQMGMETELANHEFIANYNSQSEALFFELDSKTAPTMSVPKIR